VFLRVVFVRVSSVDATESGTKPEISLSQTRPYLSAAQICVALKATQKQTSANSAARVFRLRCTNGTPVWTRFPRFPKREWGLLINPYSGYFHFCKWKENIRLLFHSFINYSLTKQLIWFDRILERKTTVVHQIYSKYSTYLKILILNLVNYYN